MNQQTTQARLRRFLRAAVFTSGLVGMFVAAQHSPIPANILLEFPPHTVGLTHLPFSWLIWSFYFVLAAISSSWVVAQTVRIRRTVLFRSTGLTAIVAGCLCLAAGWICSWELIPIASAFKPYSFVLLWVGYVVVVEGVVVSLGAPSPISIYGSRYFLLFPASAVFWWGFEVLNRFVQNWSYPQAAQYSAGEYLGYASLAFSTVLPAVFATWRLLRVICFPEGKIVSGFRLNRALRDPLLAASMLLIGLTFVYPNQLFALLWIGPLLAALGVSLKLPQSSIGRELSEGNWNAIASWAAAALICGFFWEFWNYWAELKWIYHIPSVARFYVFEMPLVGFAGYLPFGLLCGIVTEWITGSLPESLAGPIHTPVLPEPTERSALPAPKHIAIIMDGNGRWATRRALPRLSGHRAGVQAIERVVESSMRLGVRYLTLYAFSTENWTRPPSEVQYLMEIFQDYLQSRVSELAERGIRLRVIGDLERLPLPVRQAVAQALERTANNSSFDLILAISYGSRMEIRAAVRAIAEKVAAAEITPDRIDDELIRGNLYCADVPDPDLIIRTSGEQRLSNFLLWQSAYSELVFVKQLWPDFNAELLQSCIDDFLLRKRRFGGIGV